ncbi:MAG: substrate-binding domain-containing protein [Spirochaetes bacterium]|nr:substrate-binding domain-containing protein [Spirochaetota bacterium]
MKRVWVVCFIIAILVPGILLAGGRKKDAEKKAAPAVEEGVDMDEIDPLWAEMHALEEEYINPQVKFTGTAGEQPVYDDDLYLTRGEVEKIRSMNLTAVYVDNNLAGEYTLAIHGGAIDVFEYLNIEVLAETQANFDAAKQASDVETVMALDPDIVIGYVVDPVTGAQGFKPVVDAGKVLVFVSTRPEGYMPGREYTGISTNNPYDNAWVYTMDMINAVDDGAAVGIIVWGGDYFVLNVMDDATRDALEEHGSKKNLKVYEEGNVDPMAAGELVTAMVQKWPEIEAFTLLWFDPAMVAVQDLRGMGRDDIQIFTFGMNTPALLDLLDPDGMIKSLSQDFTWNIGMNTATIAAYGVLGKEAPQLVTVPTLSVTPDNLREIWKVAYRGVPMPKEVDEALKKLGK